MTTTKVKTTFKYAVVLLVALCLIRNLAAAALSNTGGLFLTPVTKDLGIGMGSLSIYFSVSAIASVLFMPIAGQLVKKYSLKLLMIIAIVLQASSFAAFGLMNSVWGWYILSIPFAIGGALLVNLAGPILIDRWFREKAATALGIMMACYGIFGAIFQPTIIELINKIGWRDTYIYVGLTIGAIVLVLIVIFIRNFPPDTSELPDLSKKPTMDTNSNSATQAKATAPTTAQIQQQQAQAVKGATIKQALKSPAFYTLILFMIGLTAFGAFSQYFEPYGLSLGYQSADIGMVISTSMIGNTVGAIFIGLIAQKIGPYKTTFLIMLVIGCSIAALAFAKVNIGVFYLGAFLFGVGGMSIPVLGPLLTSSFFGYKDYEQIYSNIMMGPPLATVICIPVYGFIYQMTKSYEAVMVIMAVFAVLALLCFMFGWKAKAKLLAEVNK